MGGLGYLEVLEDGSYKGPIDKFIPDDCKEEFRTLAGLEVGDTIFFMADKEERAAYYAGMIRNELGEKLGSDREECIPFLLCPTISRCLRKIRRQRRSDLPIIHSPCHRAA